MPIPIRHVADRSRFEAGVDGHACHADYRLAAGVMELTHTEGGRPRLKDAGSAAT